MEKVLTVKEIKELLIQDSLSSEEINQLRMDSRVGVTKLIEQFEKKQAMEEDSRKQFKEMMKYEQLQFSRGNVFVAGMDEAGRGPLAGPVVAAAVILPKDFYLPGLNDSKQIKQSQREIFFEKIKNNAVSYGIGVIHNDEIDSINIYQATKKAMKKAVQLLKPIPDHILIDAVPLEDLPCTSESIIKGDQKSVSIAAASIIAKVTRDRMMTEMHEEYPIYNFVSNKGYGTKEHLEAINDHGISPYHRTSFEPIYSLVRR